VPALCIVASHSYMPGICNLLIVTHIACVMQLCVPFGRYIFIVIGFVICDCCMNNYFSGSQVSALCIVAAHSYMPGRCNLLIVTCIASCYATMCSIWAVHFYYFRSLNLYIKFILIIGSC
jgi:hypothetical protein